MPLPRIIGLAVAWLACALLAGCSTLRLGYTNLPEITYWWLDGYVDLNSDQSVRLKADLSDMHDWHRREELPRYIELLQQAELMARNDITPAQVCQVLDQLQTHARTLLLQTAPAGARLAVTLQPEQIEHMARKFAKNEAQFRAEWLEPSPARRHDKRVTQQIERSESFYGTLSAAQRQVVHEQQHRTSFEARASLALRQTRHQEILKAARQAVIDKPAPAQAQLAWKALADRMLTPPEPALRAYQQTLMQESCRNVAALHNATTPAQRDAAAQRLRAYQRELQALATQR